MSDLQKRVGEFLVKYPVADGRASETLVLSLAAEVGELAKEILKSSNYGKRNAEYTPSIKEEVGDVLYLLTYFANKYQIDMGEALEGTLSKLENRIVTKGDMSSGK